MDELYICCVSNVESENYKGLTLKKTKISKHFELKLGSDEDYEPLDFLNTGKFVLWHTTGKIFSVEILSLMKNLERDTNRSSLVVEGKSIKEIFLDDFYGVKHKGEYDESMLRHF